MIGQNTVNDGNSPLFEQCRSFKFIECGDVLFQHEETILKIKLADANMIYLNNSTCMFDRLSGKSAREVKITEKSSEKTFFIFLMILC
jgi:hypothetical protein